MVLLTILISTPKISCMVFRCWSYYHTYLYAQDVADGVPMLVWYLYYHTILISTPRMSRMVFR